MFSVNKYKRKLRSASSRKLLVEVSSQIIEATVEPVYKGHPQDLRNWPLNTGSLKILTERGLMIWYCTSAHFGHLESVITILNGRLSAYSSFVHITSLWWRSIMWLSFRSRVAEKGKNNKERQTLDSAIGWPRPLNRGNKYSVCMSEKWGLSKLAA